MALAALLAFFSLRSFSQIGISTGNITGVIEDSGGAVVPQASIAISNAATGLKQSTLSNQQGIYTFSAVPVGLYHVTVTAPGFRASEITDLSVTIGQTTAANVQMQVGDISQQVTVSASAEVLNTSNANVDSVIERNLIDNLPSLRRNFTDFALLTPTATTDGQFGDVTFAGSTGGAFSGYSISNASNAFAVDGANATSRYWGSQRGLTRIPYLFGAESVQEFQVAIDPYSPDYGGGATGFVNTVTRSGTNSFHGQAFYYNRNSATGAVDAVTRAAGLPKVLDVRQQFGAGLGGPIKKDKLFFYFNYEQQRRKDPISVLNPAESAVNETNFGVPAGTALPAPTGYPVPTSLTAPDPSNPVYLQNVSNALSEIYGNLGIRKRRQDDLVFFERVDLLATEKDQISFAYNYNTFNSPGGTYTYNPVPNNGISDLSSNAVRDHSAVIHWVHTFQAALSNDAHISYTRDEQITSPSGLAPDGFLPTVKLTIPSSFTIGNTAPSDLREYEWAGNDRLSYITGRHTLDFGADISRDSIVSLSEFTGTYTFATLANFALGQYSLYSQTSGTPIFRVLVPTYGFYAGDTFKATPKLTLNLGFRYDFQVYPQPPLNPAIPLTGQYNNDYDRWAPRGGFAYNIFPRTVIRGGFGVFRAFLTVQNYIGATTANGLASLRSSVALSSNSSLAPNAQSLVFPNILPSSSSLFAASPNVNVISPGLRDPSTLQGSLQVEQQLAQTLTVTVGSIWVHGEHLISDSYYDLNLEQPNGTTEYITCPPNTTVVPCAGTNSVTVPTLDAKLLHDGAAFPGVGQVKALISPGNNTYVSGFFKLREQFSHGFSGILSYTLSKNIVSNGTDFNDQFSFANTKALSLLDQRHRVVFGGVYQPQLNATGLVKTIFSNWNLSTTSTFASGRPFAGVLTPACVGTSLATCTGGSNLNDSSFNYSQGIAAAGPSPNYGLNFFEGPWTEDVDLSLERSFNIKEHGKVTFRATAFNSFNHPNYYVQSGSSGQGVNQTQYRPLGPTCGDGKTANQVCYLIPNNGPGGFGQYLAVAQNIGPRIFQFALIYRF